MSRWLRALPLLAMLPAISNAAPLELTVSPDPPRLMSPLLFTDPAGVRSGVRFVALEEVEGKLVNYAFDEAGRVEGGGFTAAQTKGEVELRVQAAGAIGCRLTNTATRLRRLALWMIVAVPPRGTLVFSNAGGIEAGRRAHGRLTSFWASAWNAPGLSLEGEAVALDLERSAGVGSIKYGTRSNAGWIAGLRPDLGQMLLGRTTYRPGDQYPDEDCNLEIWAGMTMEKVSYAEMEWLSPWQDLAPGRTLAWSVTLETREYASAATGAKALVEAVRAPARRAGTAPVEGFTLSGARMVDAFGQVTAFYGEGDALAAKAPLWYNAPKQTAEGALAWTADTLVEAVPAAIPAWDIAAGRRWVIDFAETPGAPEEARRLLLQDGNREAGLAIYLEKGRCVAALWSGSESREVGEPITERRRLEVALEPGAKTLKMGAQTEAVPFEMATPGRRLGIARNAQWPATLEPAEAAGFEGVIYEVGIR